MKIKENSQTKDDFEKYFCLVISSFVQFLFYKYFCVKNYSTNPNT